MKAASAVLFFSLAAALPSRAVAEMKLDYISEIGHSSNLFEDTNNLSGTFWQGTLKLRGSLEQDGTKLSYDIRQTEMHTGRYRFGDRRETELNLGYSFALGKDALVELEAAYLRSSSGDVLLALPQSIIGYRTTDQQLQFAGQYTTSSFIGKTVAAVKASALKKGDARFTINLLQPTKLDPDVSLAGFNLSHYAPALGGELCFCGEIEGSFIAKDEQKKYARFPATKLRGSLAYARAIGTLTLVGEAGFTILSSDSLAPLERISYPYLRTEAMWKPNAVLEASIGYKRSLSIGDIDDAVAEDTRLYSATLAARIMPGVAAGLSYTFANSEYVYYIYNRKRRSLSAKLVLGADDRPKFEIEYARIVQSESDADANYKANTISARVNGSF